MVAAIVPRKENGKKYKESGKRGDKPNIDKIRIFHRAPSSLYQEEGAVKVIHEFNKQVQHL